MLPHPRKQAFVLCLSVLAALSFAEWAQARADGLHPFDRAFLLFGVLNIVFYAVVLSCLAWGFLIRRRKRWLASCLIFIAMLPFLHYAVGVVRTQLEPNRRFQQLSGMKQQRTVPAILPRSLEMMNLFQDKEIAALIAVGAVDEVQSFNPRANKTYVYELQKGPECVDFETYGGTQAELRRVVLARHAFQRCVKRTEREGPANAPVQLFTGYGAPSRYAGPACLGGGNNPIELRWAPRQGGALLAFWESPSYIGYAFPPLIGGENIWQCKTLPYGSPHNHVPDKFKFVSAVLGFKEVDDFPRSPDPSIVPNVLRQLLTKLNAQHAHDGILALLGQWPSTPAIDKTLDDQQLFKHGGHIIRTATALLTDPREAERKNRLYPHLSTHVPTLLKICSHYPDPHNLYNTKESCSNLALSGKS